MSNELVPRLKPWVTTFSEAIKLRYKHGDELCVGGKIKRIFDLHEITKDPDDMVQMTLDDDVGEIAVMIPSEVYTRFLEKYSLNVGMTVLANGRVFDPEGLLKKNITPACLLCWKIEPLAEKNQD